MGVMDKFLNYMKLNGEDDDEYYDEDYLDEDEEMEPARPQRKAPVSKTKEVDEDYEERPSKKLPPANKITPINKPAVRRSAGGAGMEVCVIKPTSVEEAREITETLLANRTVVLNLEGLDVDIAQRIIDFTSGSCFAIGGNLQKISHYIFIITPASVDISGDFQDIFGGSFEMPINNQ
ncbi:MAG: cell division protein SepF [Acetatifactor sp.]